MFTEQEERKLRRANSNLMKVVLEPCKHPTCKARVRWKHISDGKTSLKSKFFANVETAIEFADKKERELNKFGEVAGIDLSSEELHAIAEFRSVGMPKSLPEIIRQSIEEFKNSASSQSVLEAANTLIKQKQNDETLNKRYVSSLKRALNQVTGKFGDRPVRTLRTQDVNEWIEELSASGLSPKTVRHYRQALVQLMRYAGLKEEASSANLPKIGEQKKEYYSPGEIKDLLNYYRGVYPALLGACVLGCFCGLRTSEIWRVEWEDIDLSDLESDGESYLQGGKTGSRVFPLPSIAKKWLKLIEEKSGPVYKSKAQEKDRAIVLQFAKHWPESVKRVPNGLRHSFATYRTASTKNIAQVALEMGNSPQIAMKHYISPRFSADAKEFWAILPDVD